MDDGANAQARAVLAYMSRGDGIEESWNGKEYAAKVIVARWSNCREQGYVCSMRAPAHSANQLNIAFFEHRNSDNICAVKWEQSTINPPDIDTAEFGSIYKDKWDVSHTVKHGEALKMADWIMKQFTQYWIDHLD